MALFPSAPAATLSDPGLYRRYEARKSASRAAVFLDRDGVLVEEVGYLHKPQDIQLIRGAPQAMALLAGNALPVVVVTNQAGIGRGYYGWSEFEQVQEALLGLLKPYVFHGVWACAYHPEAGLGALREDHAWRKPNPGMLLDAATVLDLDLGRCWLIGDKILDLQCAINARLYGAVLVRTGYGRMMQGGIEALDAGGCQIHVADDIRAAAELISGRMRADEHNQDV